MPIIKSAKKRVRLAAKASARNVKTKRKLREALKTFSRAVEAGKPAEITKAHQAAISAIDIAAKKAVIHKNKAGRRKAQLAAAAKKANVKPAKSPAKKPAARAPAKKKTPVKKKSSTKKS